MVHTFRRQSPHACRSWCLRDGSLTWSNAPLRTRVATGNRSTAYKDAEVPPRRQDGATSSSPIVAYTASIPLMFVCAWNWTMLYMMVVTGDWEPARRAIRREIRNMVEESSLARVNRSRSITCLGGTHGCNKFRSSYSKWNEATSLEHI